MSKLFIAGKVRLIEERFHEVWVSGAGKNAKTRQESLGWFLVLDTGAGFGFGALEPECRVGDDVFLEFRRSKHEGELS